MQNFKVSIFESVGKIMSDKTISIKEVLSDIQTGKYKDKIDIVRNKNLSSDRRKGVKESLPMIACHGLFDGERKKASFTEASGLIIIDIDKVEEADIEETKQEIIDGDDSVFAAMTSPSGNGIKLLYYVQPDLIHADNYRQIGKQIAEDFSEYGDVDYLSVTDCLIATYDPNILINEDAIPAFLFIKSPTIIKSELEPLDESKTLWEDVEDFFDTVLADDIAAKTNNNFHYIQVAVLDLGKFGFTHPKEDLSFVIDYAEAQFHQSNDNKKRFLEVAEIAKMYPQSKWAYKLVSEYGDDEEDEEWDWSEYVKEEESKKTQNDSALETSEESGMIDYQNLYSNTLAVAKEGNRVGFEVSLKSFANIFRFRGSGILTVTGIPGHGKTEFIDALITDLARLYGQESICCGFEQTPEEHIIKLIRKVVGADVTCPSFLKDNEKTFKEGFDFVTNHVKHIETKKTGGNINNILEAAAKEIKEAREAGRDPKYVVIDPFNMLSIKGKFTGHEKIEEILRRLTHFSHQMDVLIILIAHPFKMKKDEKTGKYETPDFYSVKGSSAFFEMSYHGLVVYRTGYSPYDPVEVTVLKVKQNNLGTTGEKSYFNYEKDSGRYIPIDIEGNEEAGDHRDMDWLEKISLVGVSE